MLTLAWLVARSAEQRRASLGVHFREDADPQETPGPPEHWVAKRSEEGLVFSRASVELGLNSQRQTADGQDG